MDDKLLRGMGDGPLAGRINYCRNNLKGWLECLLNGDKRYKAKDVSRCIEHWNGELKQAEKELNRRKEAACTAQSHDDSSRCKTQSTTSV